MALLPSEVPRCILIDPSPGFWSNFSNGTVDLLQHDKARVAALRDPSTRGHGGSTPVTNNDSNYIAAVGVSNPPQPVNNLIVDTGSSNTLVGASTKYVVTGTSINTSQPVVIWYGSSFFAGAEYLDTVTLGCGLTITNQSIGVASTSSGFTGVDGILGIGPVDLTEGTLMHLPTATIPTVTDNLYSQDTIPHDVVSVFFEPSSSRADTEGKLTFGGTGAPKYTDDIAYTPIIATFILIVTDAFTKYQSATGATLDTAIGYLMVSSANYSALKNLGSEFTAIHSSNASTLSDTANSRVGFAKTSLTDAATN
ncbi:acid protease [Suillus decipiens]|nr:acid protease [Suillus decipiens]